ncbi:hypothetical protein SPRG_06047 [Saprolegnia parasitica CBS 223.65]|uniref:Peptidase C1A papain C-terminal domain-containing protein n=1 Tax=Saprolegnia parasitica (strain CBS 223.65) TaxID=695850 RepID=A0A067CQX7_SAPPC|nr:hypothetical protein SPRG_06047 [Saprolegnia parasitica CBS 223.65]KDO28946.1 hypothetical protein SPRG_06047 [Saprolegnia parasitica CBS 223.65]|eukprot:XP_012200162.1 hypothetical protein SPRG_06047 [Saprolegnia parasitica CBS 223.65]
MRFLQVLFLMVIVLLAWVTTVDALNISAHERDELSRDLRRWQKRTLTTDDLLGRLKASKDKLPMLRAANPHATFSHLTKFALLTDKELARFTSSPRVRSPASMPYDGSGSAATDTIDWLASKCVYPVQSMGACFSVWAITAIQAVASANCIATNALLDISLQEVVSCANMGGPDGCHGGDAIAALRWLIMQQTALCNDVDIPYTAGSSAYAPTCSDNSKCAGAISFAVSDVVEKSGEALLEKHVRVQPVLAMVSASVDTWFLYTGGILSSCPQTKSAFTLPLLVVGYSTENGVAYWKVRNGWGTVWGEQGHMRLLRGIGGRGTCNVAAHFAFPAIPSRKP